MHTNIETGERSQTRFSPDASYEPQWFSVSTQPYAAFVEKTSKHKFTLMPQFVFVVPGTASYTCVKHCSLFIYSHNSGTFIKHLFYTEGNAVSMKKAKPIKGAHSGIAKMIADSACSEQNCSL